MWFGKCHEEFSKFSPEHVEVSELGLSSGLFIKSTKCTSLKLTWESHVMTMKNDAKFEKELTCQFKTDIGTSQILTQALKNLKNLHFDELLLTKVFNI